MAALAPMPRASETIATTVTNGVRNSVRNASRMLRMTEFDEIPGAKVGPCVFAAHHPGRATYFAAHNPSRATYGTARGSQPEPRYVWTRQKQSAA